MKGQKITALALSATLALGVGGMLSGCGQQKKDYDLYIYNTKSEIADSIQNLCKDYEKETGVKVKVYTCGTQETMETLRSEMNSKKYPTLYAINQSQFKEWSEGGFTLAASKTQNTELQKIYESVPEAMRLSDTDGENYGIPYNVEGYGLIADKQMICDVFGLDSADDFISDYRSANYEEFTGMINAIDDYIEGKGGETVTLSGNEYVTANGKTDTTKDLNGVFAIAGAEKWAYANHYINYALNAVFANYTATANATSDEVDQLEEPMVKMIQELDMLSQHTAGPNGEVERGSEYINSTVTGYDQAVQTFAEGKAMFIKQGNWVYSNIQSVDKEKSSRLTMLPLKVNLTDSDITAEGVTADKMNTSIPEFVSQYYVINAKDTQEEQKAAEDFLVWLYTSDTGKDYMVNKFGFVPFNADSSTKLDNPLSNDLVYYMENNAVLGNDFDAFPESWGTNTIGKSIQEQLFTNPDSWKEDEIRKDVKDALAIWKESIK